MPYVKDFYYFRLMIYEGCLLLKNDLVNHKTLLSLCLPYHTALFLAIFYLCTLNSPKYNTSWSCQHMPFFLLLSSVMFLTFMTLHIPPPLSRIFLLSGVLLLDPTVDSYVELSLGFFSLCSASGSQGLILSSHELFNDC